LGKEKPMFSLGNLNGKPIDLLLCTFTPSFTLCSSSKLNLSWVVIGRRNAPHYGKKKKRVFFWWWVRGMQQRRGELC